MYVRYGAQKYIDEIVGEAADAQVLYAALSEIFSDIPDWAELHRRLPQEGRIVIATPYCEITINQEQVIYRRVAQQSGEHRLFSIFFTCRILRLLPPQFPVNVGSSKSNISTTAQTLAHEEEKNLPSEKMRKDIERTNYLRVRADVSPAD